MAEKECPEIRLALFGASASGKTTLLSSYYGNQQRDSFEKNYKYRLEAEDITVGNMLLSQYYTMEKKGSFPLGTEKFMEQSFALKIVGLPEPCLRIKWFDYPGGWWERSPADAAEKHERKLAFKRLLESHVGILLIDGMRYQADGLPYIRLLLDQFKSEIRRILDSLASENDPLSKFPKEWILAITKADLLPPETTAEDICKDIVGGAVDQINGAANAVNSNAFGDQFLLLSSVQGDGFKVIDAHKHIGLTMIAPVGLLAILTGFIEDSAWGHIYNVFGYVCRSLSGIVDIVDKLDDFLPKRYQVLTQLLTALAIKDGLEKGEEYFRKKREEEVKIGDSIKAVANLMQELMASDEAKRIYFRSQGPRL